MGGNGDYDRSVFITPIDELNFTVHCFLLDSAMMFNRLVRIDELQDADASTMRVENGDEKVDEKVCLCFHLVTCCWLVRRSTVEYRLPYPASLPT